MKPNTETRLHLRNLTIEAIADTVAEWGEPSYRTKQILEWVYGRLVDDVDAMTNLPLSLRNLIDENFVIRSATPTLVQESQHDGTRKYLFELVDGGRVESVLMRYPQRTTLCVSSQVGCPLDCVFCETAKGQFLRNLSAGEILDQVCVLKSDSGFANVNVVFMGMGEPLLNIDNLILAIRTLNHEQGLGMGNRRITVSTSSFPDRIRDLADAEIKCSLALSLNAPNDVKRKELMPKASRFTIEQLLDAALYFASQRGRRVTMEYVMLGGLNTSKHDAEQLGKLIRGTPFKLNLIPYNPGREAEYNEVSETDIDRFIRWVKPYSPTVTVRRSRGLDIDAACGQLWTKSLAVD